MLLEASADVNAQASDGATALADVNIESHDCPRANGTALSHACYYCQEEIAHLLMENGAGKKLVHIFLALEFTVSAGLPATSEIVRLLTRKKRRRLGQFACRMFKVVRGRMGVKFFSVAMFSRGKDTSNKAEAGYNDVF